MDLYMLPSLLERPIEWVRRECLHSSIMKASVGSKRAVEDSHRHTDGPLYNYSSAVHFSVSIVTVASHARHAKHEQQRSK